MPLDLATAGRRTGRPGARRYDQHRDSAASMKKNDMRPWIVETWCSPPHADADFVWRMEDGLQTYQLRYDPRYPVVCVDEACKQLFGEVRPSQRPRPGKPGRMDYEYERKGVCHQLMMCEPLRGWRHVKVTARRTRQEDARCVRALVEDDYPQAKKIRLVQDNLNTHDRASLYEAFPPQKARRILDKLEFHYTPKHGSWLNMAETEIGIMNPPLRKGHSRFWTVCRCSLSQCRNRSCTEAGSCKTKCTKLRVSKISKWPPAYAMICVRRLRSCSNASA